MPPAVGFDLDGTLLDHDAAAVAGLARLIVVEGLAAPEEPHHEAGREWIRLEHVHFSAFMAGQIDLGEQRRRRMTGILAHLGHDPADHDADALFAAYLGHYEDAWTAYPDAVSALRDLGAMGIRMGVLTNGYQEQQVAKLRRMGVLESFTCVLGLEAIPAAKPSASAFHALAGALGADVVDCVYVGDYLPNDVLGALGAGMRAIWVDRLGEGGGPEGVPVVATLEEIPALISEMS